MAPAWHENLNLLILFKCGQYGALSKALGLLSSDTYITIFEIGRKMNGLLPKKHMPIYGTSPIFHYILALK